MADLAKLILNQLRKIIYSTIPDVEENTIMNASSIIQGGHWCMCNNIVHLVYKNGNERKRKAIQDCVKAAKKVGHLDKIKDILNDRTRKVWK